ncbi:hypothetical protein PAECIP111893_04662 [Paenibacillus plantiphilus]|uniref:Uncharacterized protein n=1 Tax=Paenibacillus plantiphilus TaxID=2905650 RepID=A0ABN8GX58_9BACL|nr:hypothetical protein PAECIP111893_04662 [Paenibacillus plantiphilus]
MRRFSLNSDCCSVYACLLLFISMKSVGLTGPERANYKAIRFIIFLLFLNLVYLYLLLSAFIFSKIFLKNLNDGVQHNYSVLRL